MLLHPLVAPALTQNWEGVMVYRSGMKSMRKCLTTLRLCLLLGRGQKLRDGRSPSNVWNGGRTHVEGLQRTDHWNGGSGGID